MRSLRKSLETMLRLAWLVLVAQSAAARDQFRDHCSCHSVKSKTFTRLMFERGFRAASAHRASDLKLSPPPRDLMKPALEELWRSLRAERRQVTTADGAAREMARALNETGDWVLVYIARGRWTPTTRCTRVEKVDRGRTRAGGWQKTRPRWSSSGRPRPARRRSVGRLESILV